jgi:hypothetical protein
LVLAERLTKLKTIPLKTEKQMSKTPLHENNNLTS